ncbi:MAG: sensor histidine kinase [Bacteroidales bacterium]
MIKVIREVFIKRVFSETSIYTIAWAIILLFPLANNTIDYLTGTSYSLRWKDIFKSWIEILPFLSLFLVNHIILLPQLLLRKKTTKYIISATLCSILFISISTIVSHNQPRPPMGDMSHEGEEFSNRREKNPNIYEKWGIEKENTLQPPPIRHRPSINPILKGPFIGRMLLAILMLSFNIAVKLFFKSLKDDEAMKELENQNLQSELEYLKYQINPHFFMNTLNNIHSLVDIDTEKAKETIVELSKLMRYILYESNNKSISLNKEVEFLRNYVKLMRIRYSESVVINFNVNSDLSNIQIPPLLLISFVENAFKHGVSYQKPSYISITIEITTGRLVFSCLNSKFVKNRDNHHGIGLENIRKRLELIFKDDFNLSIQDHDNSFDIILDIPIHRTSLNQS